MLAVDRRRLILAQLDALPSVRTDALASALGVSIETIRRDLVHLAGVGLLERVHGGATPPRGLEAPYAQRRVANVGGKRAMGRVAVQLLHDGDTAIFDIGTSIVEAARCVPPTWSGRVLTSSLLVAGALAGRSGVEVIVCGGHVRADDLALAGGHAEAFFAEYNADLAFIGSGGLHATAGLTDFHPHEVDVRRVMLDHAAHVCVLADHTKLGAVAPRRVCGLERLTTVVSDGAPDDALARALTDAGTAFLPATASAG